MLVEDFFFHYDVNVLSRDIKSESFVNVVIKNLLISLWMRNFYIYLCKYSFTLSKIINCIIFKSKYIPNLDIVI